MWQDPWLVKDNPKLKKFKSQVTKNARVQVLKRESQVREKIGSISTGQIMKDLTCHPYDTGPI